MDFQKTEAGGYTIYNNTFGQLHYPYTQSAGKRKSYASASGFRQYVKGLFAVSKKLRAQGKKAKVVEASEVKGIFAPQAPFLLIVKK